MQLLGNVSRSSSFRASEEERIFLKISERAVSSAAAAVQYQRPIIQSSPAEENTTTTSQPRRQFSVAKFEDSVLVPHLAPLNIFQRHPKRTMTGASVLGIGVGGLAGFQWCRHLALSDGASNTAGLSNAEIFRHLRNLISFGALQGLIFELRTILLADNIFI